MEPRQPQQSTTDDFAAVPEWLTIDHPPVLNGGFPTPTAVHQQFLTGSHRGMASNTQLSPQSPSRMLPSQPGSASRGDTQAVPPHTTPHHAAFLAPARALAAAAPPTRPMPYSQQPTANRPPPPSRPRPGVRDILPIAVQQRQQPTYAPPRGPPPNWQRRAQTRYAAPPGAPPNWQGRAHTTYAPPPGPPPGWTATPPPPPLRTPGVRAPQHQTELAPSREQTASPWRAAILTPSPVISTAATTPGPALMQNPAVEGPAPLPVPAEVARSATPHTPSSGQRVVRGHEQTAAPAQIARPTLKRRIADADTGACEPGPSKRPATDASVQARSSKTDTTGRQLQQYNNILPPQHAPASPHRDAALPEPDTALPTCHEDVRLPTADDSDTGSLFGDDDCIDEDDATLAMELALALGQDDVPAVASEDADTLCEDGDSMSDAELARELALALGQDGIPAIASDDAEPLFEDGDSIGDDAELARELALALGEDDAGCAAANDDANSLHGDGNGRECPAPAAQLSLPLGLAEAGRTAGTVGAVVEATSEQCASASAQEPAVAAFALCLPGTDPVPKGGVARFGPASHLPPVAPAPMATAPSGGSRGKGKKAVRATPPHPSASSGASSSAPPREAAEPPTAPGNRGKGGARKKAPSAAHPSTAAGPSATAAAITHAAAVEKSVKRSKAMAMQNPDVFKSYSWMQGSSSASGSGPASTSFAAAAPVPARPLFTRSPPPRGPERGRRDAVKGRRYPTSEPMPKDKPFWCKMCWEDRVKTTYWYDYTCLRRHVREKHEDLLDSDVWKHEGM